MRFTEFVDESTQSQVNELRMTEYATAKGFFVNLESLKWRESDSQSHVMAVVDEEKMVATMRGEVIDDVLLLEKKLECPWELPFSPKGGVLLLSRASTASSHRGQGLNLLLRYWFLRFAKHHHIAYVMGTFVADSPRETTLRKMGYQFYENKLGWNQSTFRAERPVHIVALNMATDGEQALRYCEDNLHEELTRYPFNQLFPDLRYVRSI